MSDPLRTDSPRANDDAPDADRDAKIEQLLLAGLDHYFSAQYDQAINVWTRALFLDRSHARARAYIERARTALAECQRETDELLHSGIAAFERGEGVEARRLLQTALGRGAPADEALAVLDRLDRLEHSAVRSPAADTVRRARWRRAERGAAPPARSHFRVLAGALAVAAVLGAGIAAWLWRYPELRPDVRPVVTDVLDVFGLLGQGAARASASPEAPGGGLALPRRGEGALARAKSLEASGKLRDALAALDGVRLTDPERAEADRVQAGIQRQLIEISSKTSPGRIP
jgi:hypothetical protein